MNVAAARWISIIAHPFVMVGLMVVAVAVHLGIPRQATPALLLALAVAILPVGILMIRQVRSGSWENIDASNRSERPVLFLVGTVGLIALLACAFFFRPVSFLFRGSIGVVSMLSACAIANRWLKVSLHMAFATLVATTLVLLGSPTGWVLVPVLPALGWSRIALGRHELAEIVLGVVFGLLAGYAVYRF